MLTFKTLHFENTGWRFLPLPCPWWRSYAHPLLSGTVPTRPWLLTQVTYHRIHHVLHLERHCFVRRHLNTLTSPPTHCFIPARVS